MKARTDELRDERDHYRTTAEVFARAMHVLTVENDHLRKELGQSRTVKLAPLRPASSGEHHRRGGQSKR